MFWNFYSVCEFFLVELKCVDWPSFAFFLFFGWWSLSWLELMRDSRWASSRPLSLFWSYGRPNVVTRSVELPPWWFLACLSSKANFLTCSGGGVSLWLWIFCCNSYSSLWGVLWAMVLAPWCLSYPNLDALVLFMIDGMLLSLEVIEDPETWSGMSSLCN